MIKKHLDLLLLLKIIITLFNNNLFYIFCTIITILYLIYINMAIGAFILGVIFTLFFMKNNMISILIYILITIFLYLFLEYYIL